jgi:amino acid transporter
MAETTLEQVQLPRRLRFVETAALTFSTVGATAGLYSLFGFSLFYSGPAFVWSWLIVGVSVGCMALMWAELSSHMPLAGSVYHWAVALGGRGIGWGIGWLYLFAQCIVLTAWYFLVPITLGPLLGVEFTRTQSALITLAVIACATVLNALGIELLGKIIFIGVIFELIIGFGLTAWLFFASDHQPWSIFFNLGSSSSFSAWIPGFIGGGIFISLWVLFTFESAGAVGEETKDSHRAAPKAVLLAFVGTMVIGTAFLVTAVLAIPDVDAITNSATPLPDIFRAWLPHWTADVYLALLLGIEILGCNAFFTAVSRQLFGMARAGQLPAARQLSKTRNGTPYVAILTVGAVTALPLLIAQQMSVLAGGATAIMYLAYVSLLVVLLVARMKGWPRRDAPFKLGVWGIPANIVGLVLGAASLVTLVWPRDDTNPEVWGLRAAYWLIGVPIVLGAIVYFARGGQRAVANEDDLLRISELESQAEVASDPRL